MKQLLEKVNNDFFVENDAQYIEVMIERGVLSREAAESKWLGYPPATKLQIKAKEKLLGTNLPPSYKQFLLISNGFSYTSFFLDNLLPIQQIDWAIQTEDSVWLEYDFDIDISDEEYACYDENQDSARYRHQYLKQSLKISNWYDGMCIFLNPVIKHNLEWEVLEYANWKPGANRYKSFKDFLVKTHNTNLMIIEDKKANNM
ncbi:SMI1/KNR4 family protein [Foetidibacter luteolus]|uniref:SMI1/KNR4 family protein n=1 Tax=Foetidibacter luteolus TaxID=2608880 RepID=UPI001A9955C9|nr:SMI1/KNR4 family protein [Foetidibacter luteolus]